MREVVVVDSIRTGLGKSFKGALNATRPDDMLAHVIKEMINRHPNIPLDEIDDVVMGLSLIHISEPTRPY